MFVPDQVNLCLVFFNIFSLISGGKKVKTIKTKCKRAAGMTAATYRLTPSPSLPATPPTADYCCTSPYAGIGKLPLKTFAQQRTTTTSKFTGFLTLHRSLHSDGNRTHGGRKGCKEVTTGGGCQICQCVCVCTWCHDFV